jgi:hypothetical protein
MGDNNNVKEKYIPLKGVAATKRRRPIGELVAPAATAAEKLSKKAKEISILREYMLQKSLTDWNTYMSSIETQVSKKVKGNNNLKSLQCLRMNNGKITYRKSAFDNEVLKQLYMKYVTPMVEGTSEKALTEMPSLLRCFKDTTNRVTFWPNNIVFKYADEILKFFPFFLGVDVPFFSTYAFMESLFNGEYDVGLINRKDDLEDFTSNYKTAFSNIFKEAKTKPVCISAFESGRPSIMHGIACIAYMHGGKLTFGIFDPNFYRREGGDMYISGLITAYLIVRVVAAELGEPVDIVNLSVHCLTTEKGSHCAQYMINAEYCLFYSLYFLYLFAKSGGAANMKDLVAKTYIVTPSELGREPCAANKRFRLIMMSFILNCWALALGSPEYRADIKVIHDTVLEKDGFQLLTDGVLKELVAHGGGRTRRARRKTFRVGG